MDYSKKPVNRSSQRMRTAAGRTKQRNLMSSQSNQDRTRSISSEEVAAIRNRTDHRETTSRRSYAAGAASEKRSEPTRRRPHQSSRTQTIENRKVTQKTRVSSDSMLSGHRSGPSRTSENTAVSRSKKAVQRKNAIRKAAARQENIPPRGPSMAPPKKRRRPLSKPVKIIMISLLVLIIGGTGYCWWLVTGNLNKDLNSSSVRSAYHISDEAAAMAKTQRIVNIAVFGIDGRDDPDVIGDRSDAIMIASADFEHGGVKITSVMRDSFVWIDAEDSYDKINAAYSLGGPETALQTINQNFDTAITDYVTVNFDCMLLLVNAVGGVEVTIDDPEVLYWTNQYIGDVNFNCGTNSGQLTDLGTQTLDGSQALAYCRVRYTGNGDFDRTLRQREVFKQVVLKTLDLNPFAQYALLQSVLPYVETSLTSNEIIKYALNVMLMNGRELSQMQLPTSDYCEAGYYDDISYVFPVTLADNVKAWYQFVYERDYTPSQTVREISNEISYIW